MKYKIGEFDLDRDPSVDPDVISERRPLKRGVADDAMSTSVPLVVIPHCARVLNIYLRRGRTIVLAAILDRGWEDRAIYGFRTGDAVPAAYAYIGTLQYKESSDCSPGIETHFDVHYYHDYP